MEVGTVSHIEYRTGQNPADPGSYRGICILSVLGKVLERLMVAKLELAIVTTFSDAQYGFVRGRSTEIA